MITQEFEFRSPTSLAEVFSLLERHGDEAKVLAGGMSLIPMMSLGLLRPALVVSLNRVAGLSDIKEDGNVLRLGARATHTDIAGDSIVARHCPLLAQAAAFVGDVQVRNRGTLGGSLAHADPAADYPPVVVAAGARMVIAGSKGRREVAANDFFTGLMETAVGPGEVLVEVVIPKSAAGAAYRRLHRIEGNFAIVNAAAMLGDRPVVAVGGVGPKPLLLDISDDLRGGVTAAALNKIGQRVYEATSDAPEDLNASTEYRRQMASLYAQRAVEAAAGRNAAGR